MRRRYRVLAALLALLGAGAAAASGGRIAIRVDGAVSAAQSVTLRDDARYSDGALAVPLRSDAYVLGAALLRPAHLLEQRRLKVGVLYDLDRMHAWALLHDKPALADRVRAMSQAIAALPVTGREVALLDPRAVEASAARNRPLADGDRLYYPSRPRSVRVVGAVANDCTVPLLPLQDARRYLEHCPPDADADPDTLYVIQPDGTVTAQGYALWNRGTPTPLAPGAIIYVPLRQDWTVEVDSDLNADLAAFLATQVLPLEAAP